VLRRQAGRLVYDLVKVITGESHLDDRHHLPGVQCGNLGSSLLPGLEIAVNLSYYFEEVEIDAVLWVMTQKFGTMRRHSVTVLKSKSKITIFCQNRPKSKLLSLLSHISIFCSN